MDAATLIRENADIVKLLEHYNFTPSSEDDVYIRGQCPLHGGNNETAFVINKENNYWYCHTGNCGGGDVFSLVQQKEEITFAESIVFLANFFHLDITDMQIVEQSNQGKKEVLAWIATMRSRIKKQLQPFTITNTRKVKGYKNFLPNTLEHFNLQYATNVELISKAGKPFTLHDRLAFPIVQKGVQVGVSFRATNDKQTPKWLHAPTSLETKNLLYNYDAAIGKQEVVLVEGITDVWAYHEIGITAVATFGAHITDEQYKQIIRLSCDVILSYDGDEAGNNITDKAKLLFKNKCNLYQIHMEQGEDPASIEREVLRERFQSRRYCRS